MNATIEKVSVARAVGAGKYTPNISTDVRLVQTQLNLLMPSSRKKLVVDGVVGRNSRKAIREFQRVVVGYQYPDGRIDPRGKTEVALNDLSSATKWSQSQNLMPLKKLGQPVPTNSETRNIAYITAAIDDIAEKDPDLSREIESFIDDNLPELRGILGLVVNGRIATQVVLTIRWLKSLGLSNKDVMNVFNTWSHHKHLRTGKTLLFIQQFAEGSPKLLSALKGLKNGAIIASIFICAYEVAGDIQKSNYGAAAGRVYRLAMGYVVPWAGLIDAFGRVLEALFPDVQSKSLSIFLDVLKSANPAMLGGVAVDTVGSLIQATIESYVKGKIDMSAIEKLGDRLKSSPASIFGKVPAHKVIPDSAADWWYENVLS